MAGSTYGTLFTVTTWGESHGAGIGVVIDGCPAGLSLSEEDIQTYLNRRKPGQSQFSTKRKESDTASILSGVFEGKTTGTPISIFIKNEDQHSKDYGNLKELYRPGHADYTFDAKYGFRDYRGGGRSSGRETIGRVAAGAIACKILAQLGITVTAYTKAIGTISVPVSEYNYHCINENNLYMPNNDYAVCASDYLERCMKNQNSSGGVIECIVEGMPAGIGEPVFDKLDANLSRALFSIGAVKAVEIGDGIKVASMKGSENNDAFVMNGASRKPVKTSNHSGGTLGGLTDGAPLTMRVAIKPTPSIAAPQHTVNKSGQDIDIEIHGRHDPIIVPRAVVVVEAMAAITILDALLENMSSRVDRIVEFYK